MISFRLYSMVSTQEKVQNIHNFFAIVFSALLFLLCIKLLIFYFNTVKGFYLGTYLQTRTIKKFNLKAIGYKNLNKSNEILLPNEYFQTLLLLVENLPDITLNFLCPVSTPNQTIVGFDSCLLDLNQTG